MDRIHYDTESSAEGDVEKNRTCVSFRDVRGAIGFDPGSVARSLKSQNILNSNGPEANNRVVGSSLGSHFLPVFVPSSTGIETLSPVGF